MKFTRITTRPDVCTGKPCVRDLRFPVSRLLGLLAAGQSRDEMPPGRRQRREPQARAEPVAGPRGGGLGHEHEHAALHEDERGL